MLGILEESESRLAACPNKHQTTDPRSRFQLRPLLLLRNRHDILSHRRPRLIRFFILLLLISFFIRSVPAYGEAEPVEQSQTDMSVQWKPLLLHSLFYMGVANGFRLATEQGTRDYLSGPFIPDYFRAVGNMHGWSDGDPFLVNYIGHPMEGAVAGFMFVHYDPKYRSTEFGMSDTYWKSRLRATAYAWAWSVMFEIGPMSEASIGNIQSLYPAQGFVDWVITPTMGLVWMAGEDALDKYLIKRIEGYTRNRFIRIMTRSFLNPSRSFANCMNWERPWDRDTRPGVSEYDPNLWAIALKKNESPGAKIAGGDAFLPGSKNARNPMQGVSPRIPAFEFSAYYDYSRFTHGGMASGSCIGGGATGVFQLNRWIGAMADVAGCKLSSNDPNITGDSLTYLFGPRFSFRQGDRWTFNLDLLFGGSKLTQDQVFPERIPTGDLTEWNKLDAWVRHDLMAESTEANGFAMAVGGGIDLKLRKGIALRLGNVQFVRTSIDNFHNLPYTTMFRFTTGLVLRAGEL
ncbi:MAG: hypothetical protein U0V70_13985 [Terriglobia bacterium]